MSERELGPHRIPKQMVDSIPGPILLPAKFVLSADQQDLADWDEPDTPWIEDTSYWLYIFCQEQTAQRNLVRFACEIFVDCQGEMHEVNLEKSWAAAKRPAPDATKGRVVFQIGYAMITSTVVPYAVWIWASPFQMARSRLPSFDDITRTCRLSVFQKWADLRGLEPFALPTEKYEGHALTIPVKAPWIHAFALNRVLSGALDALGARLSDEGLKARFLYSAIHRVPNYALHLDTKRFSDFYGEILRDELVYQQRVDEATIRLSGYLEGAVFTAIWDDMKESEDPSAKPKMHVISARSHNRLFEARAAVPYLSRVTEKQGKFLESSFSTVLASRSARKVAKAYWNLVKMFVTTAKLPRWAITACQDFAKEWYGVTLALAKPGAGARVFTVQSVQELTRRSTEHPVKTGFFLCVEIANVVPAIYDAYSHRGEPDNWKRVVNSVGALASLGGAAFDHGVANGFGSKGSQQWMRRAAGTQPGRYIKSIFGAVASATDLFLGIENAGEAGATGDDRAALFHGATAVGGAVGIVGYVLLAGGATAPIGAALVFLGSAVGAGGNIGAAIFHDSEFDEWLKFCRWGKLANDPEAGKSLGRDIERPWSEGPLRTLGGDLDRQIRTLNALIHKLKVDLKFTFTSDGKRLGIDVSASMEFLGNESTIWLEVMMNHRPIRSWSPWKKGSEASGVQASFHEHFPGPDCRVASIRLRVDMFGDQKHWFPTKDVIASAESTRIGPELFNPYVGPT
jgi:hypothetical protein